MILSAYISAICAICVLFLLSLDSIELLKQAILIDLLNQQKVEPNGFSCLNWQQLKPLRSSFTQKTSANATMLSRY